MIKKEIVEKISSYFKISSFEAEKIYDDIFESIIDSVKKDSITELDKLGEFIARANPLDNTGKIVEFLPSHSFEEEIRHFDPLLVANSSTQSETSQLTENTSIASQNIGDELKKKRDEILSKLTATPEVNQIGGAFTEHGDSKESVTTELEKEAQKSFSDYFSEVKEINQVSTVKQVSGVSSEFQHDLPPVIPPSAVELHKEITGEIKNEPQTIEETNRIITNGNGYEHKNPDNSYYIWYRDSEPNQTDTQTMSYEYELLYQATKEAEYKSKLKVYVTSFILFFSIVLLLLIFSPVIYRYFFTPVEETQEVIEETGMNNEEETETSVTQQIQETQPITRQSTTSEQTPQSSGDNKNPVIPNQQTQSQQLNNNTTSPGSSQEIEGVTKNSMGWMDEKNKVIYVQLDNGKYTIQESAWDSDLKANKRINAVAAFLPGLKGNVVKADLGTKGTWYRARFGEFATLGEARKKAEELRSKEKIKLQAYLFSFLFFT